MTTNEPPPVYPETSPYAMRLTQVDAPDTQLVAVQIWTVVGGPFVFLLPPQALEEWAAAFIAEAEIARGKGTQLIVPEDWPKDIRG